MCFILLFIFLLFFFFFFNYSATTEIYTLSLHDALPICGAKPRRRSPRRVQDPGDGGGPALPHPHVRHPDPARRLHLHDLAAQEELAEAPTGRGRGAYGSRGCTEVREVSARRSLIGLSLGGGRLLKKNTGGHSTAGGPPSGARPITVASFDFVESEILARSEEHTS